MLERKYLSSEQKEFFKILKVRYNMLLQGTSVELLPSVRNFIEDECNLSYNYDLPVIKKSNEKHQKNYPSIQKLLPISNSYSHLDGVNYGVSQIEQTTI